MKSARKGEQRVALPEILKRQCPSVLTTIDSTLLWRNPYSFLQKITFKKILLQSGETKYNMVSPFCTMKIFFWWFFLKEKSISFLGCAKVNLIDFT